MKNLMLTLAFVLGILTVSNAQSIKETGKNEKSSMEMKAHVCTDACKEAGHCVYAHGEKGHTCAEACSKAMQGQNHEGHKHDMKMESKPHTCSDACKDGSHAYMHGEEGHTCTAACKMDMKEEDKK